MKTLIASFPALLAVLLLSCAKSSPDAQGAGASMEAEVLRQGPYIYCNVYLQDACFGIGQGDQLEMQVPVDFSLYRVSLAGGARAEIYYGTNPALPKVVNGEVTWHSENGEFRRFDEADASGETKTNYVYRPAGSKVGNIVHVTVYSSTGDGDIVKSFIENFRPCRASGPGLQCSTSKLFAINESRN
ncbi:MAG TPA: hypothetical protein VD865_11625 [Stenotrophomonas sp.]|nr:hypothetical protein [Stenotrophomonas sp.]